MLTVLSTSATIFGAGAISLIVLELGIRESGLYGKDKDVKKTVQLRRLSIISITAISLSSLSILMVIYEPEYRTTLIRTSSILLFIGISLFLVCVILLYIHSKRKS